MTFDALPLVAFGLMSVAVFWCLPVKYGQDGVATFSIIVLAVITPATAIVMLTSIVAVQQAMAHGERHDWKTAIAAAAIAALTAVLLVSREAAANLGIQWFVVGLAYSTLRHIHVVAEWRLGRIAAPSLGDYFRYHMLLPVVIAGPIHRLPHFQRQCERRRRSAAEFFAGAERTLFGFALVIIVGEYLIGTKAMVLLSPSAPQQFLMAWAVSALEWIRTYATFAGLTDIALGACLMMGLRLEENFDRPWRARNLVEFWTRWHMTLSLWCRDYVYRPVAIWLRSPLIGIFCAMLVLGLWHETSWYYMLWGSYQAAGIALWHLYERSGDPLRLSRIPQGLKAVLAPMAILAWLSSAKPVILSILGGGGP